MLGSETISTFVLIVIKLGPFEEPFVFNLRLHVSSGLQARAFINYLVFGNPDETLTLVYETLLEEGIAHENRLRTPHKPVIETMFLRSSALKCSKQTSVPVVTVNFFSSYYSSQ